jgi:hypothetical protein
LSVNIRRAYLAGLMAVAVAGNAAAGGRRALVIGNANYASLPPLPACAASARVVGAALRRAGFEVIEKADLSNGEMGSAIADFAAAAGAAPAAGAVLYVCGYAVDYGGRAFLLPASADIERDTDALTQGLTATSVVGGLARSGTHAGLVLLDAATMPKPGAAAHFDTLAAAAGAGMGLAAAVSAAPPPDGATQLAAALATALDGSDLEVGALLHVLSAKLGGESAIKLTVAAPPGPVPLAAAAPVAAPAPVAAAANPAALPDEAHMTEAERRAIQAALLRLGYYDKQVDGVFGADTRAAIRRFQHEIGADMTGTITPPQSARLLGESH